jgi:hypothetical protein
MDACQARREVSGGASCMTITINDHRRTDYTQCPSQPSCALSQEDTRGVVTTVQATLESQPTKSQGLTVLRLRPCQPLANDYHCCLTAEYSSHSMAMAVPTTGGPHSFGTRRKQKKMLVISLWADLDVVDEKRVHVHRLGVSEQLVRPRSHVLVVLRLVVAPPALARCLSMHKGGSVSALTTPNHHAQQWNDGTA